MSSERYQRVTDLFGELVGLSEPEQRAELERIGAEDEGLRAELESLLFHDRKVDATSDLFDDELIDGGRHLISGLVGEGAGSRAETPQQIGPYEIVDVLGEGGMGTVYLARQEEPIRREVALKLIKLGMDTRQVIQRFESEREALALMDHPGIARVLDAGATERGRPYFVMESFPGTPIVDFCDRRRLSVTERLRLFVDVCAAIQHAHQRGILHRDIKSHNVLVGLVDERPVAKVIDFGLARAMTEEAGPLSLVTRDGQVIGTPATMSPEQADPLCRDVDTRTDIYSLGVLLYQLLTGRLPFDISEESARDPSALANALMKDAPRPSTRFSSAAEKGAGALAERRRSNQPELVKKLRGDLDWITLKAMDKERAQRYASVSELAADVERYLEDQPVLAGPPSASYRARKFYRRNRTAVLAAAAVIFALIAGIIGTAWQGHLARVAADQLALSEQELKDALYEMEGHNEILSDMLISPDPRYAGKDVRVVDALERGAQNVLDNYMDRPRVAARALDSIGGTFRELGQFDKAEAYLRKAIEIRRTIDGERGRLAFDLNGLAILLKRTHRYDEAEACYREALEIAHEDAELLDQSMTWEFNLAKLLSQRGALDEAEVLMQSSYEKHVENKPDDLVGLAFAQSGMGAIANGKGQLEEAEHWWRLAVDSITQGLPGDKPQVAGLKAGLVDVLADRGKHDEAAQLADEAMDVATRCFDADSPARLPYIDRVVRAHLRLDTVDEVEPTLDDGLRINAATFGDSPEVASRRVYFARALRRLGRFEEAMEEAYVAHSSLRAVLPAERPDVLTAACELATAFLEGGRLDDAGALLAEYSASSDPRLRALGARLEELRAPEPGQ